MTPEKALEVIDQHIVRGQVVSKYTISEMME
jgi:NADP-reducing hydrogenase subunit HndB